ncbi:MAG: hypothetical protein ACI4V1_07565 [Eubacteriales bacterium]
MKKYIVLLLAGLMLAAAACSSEAPEESVEETETETAAPETEAETEPETKYERPADEEVIEYTTLELEKDALYDRSAGLFVMYFTNHELWYEEDAKCSIGLISDEEAFSIAGVPDFTAYPEVKVDEDDYCGIAIRIEEEIPVGDYYASITFDHYIVNFDFTAE